MSITKRLLVCFLFMFLPSVIAFAAGSAEVPLRFKINASANSVMVIGPSSAMGIGISSPRQGYRFSWQNSYYELVQYSDGVWWAVLALDKTMEGKSRGHTIFLLDHQESGKPIPEWVAASDEELSGIKAYTEFFPCRYSYTSGPSSLSLTPTQILQGRLYSHALAGYVEPLEEDKSAATLISERLASVLISKSTLMQYWTKIQQPTSGSDGKSSEQVIKNYQLVLVPLRELASEIKKLMDQPSYKYPRFTSIFDNLLTISSAPGSRVVSVGDPKKNQALIDAVHNKDVVGVRTALASGVDPNVVDKEGFTSLMIACLKGSIEIAGLLIKNGANVNSRFEGPKSAMASVLDEYRVVVPGTREWAAYEGTDIFAYGETALMLASVSGNVDLVGLLLENGARIDAVTQKNNSALFYAINANRPMVVEALLKKGAQPNSPGFGERTPLMFACMLGHASIVEKLLQAGAVADRRTSDGRNALMFAAAGGNTACLRLLIEKKIGVEERANGNYHIIKLYMDPKVPHIDYKGSLRFLQSFQQITPGIPGKGEPGITALMCAVFYGHKEAAVMLIDAGADIHAVDAFGYNSLLLTQLSQQDTTMVMDLLISRGADIKATSKMGESFLELAVLGNKPEAVRRSLASGASPEAKLVNKEGVSACVFAIREGFLEVARVLMEKGARLPSGDYANIKGADQAFLKLMLRQGYNANARVKGDKNGYIPLLHWAIETGDTEKIRILLDAGADVNITDSDGITGLILASSKGLTQVIPLLLSRKAKTDVVNKNGLSAIKAAVEAKRWDCVRLLVEGGASPFEEIEKGKPLLFAAAESGDAQTIQVLLDKGARISDRDARGWTVLHVASLHGRADLVRLLLARKADVAATSSDGTTALIAASYAGSHDCVKLLLDAGASPNSKLVNGSTPLMNAANSGSVESIRLLIDRGARVNEINVNGVTALHFAANVNKHQAVQLLLDRGANPNIADTKGLTPLFYAVTNGNVESVSLLLTRGANVNARDKGNYTPLTYAEYLGNKRIIELIRNAGGIK